MDRVMELRKKGWSLISISMITGYTLTEVCEMVFKQNQDDIRLSRDTE